jgi:hypothetical protein
MLPSKELIVHFSSSFRFRSMALVLAHKVIAKLSASTTFTQRGCHVPGGPHFAVRPRDWREPWSTKYTNALMRPVDARGAKTANTAACIATTRATSPRSRAIVATRSAKSRDSPAAGHAPVSADRTGLNGPLYGSATPVIRARALGRGSQRLAAIAGAYLASVSVKLLI